VGTGLGLSVSYGIVENMGGRLSVANAEQGARFCVELPIS
jgi:signal transduction histidine kinase